MHGQKVMRTLVQSSTLSDETSSTSTLATYKLQTTRHADGSLPGSRNDGDAINCSCTAGDDSPTKQRIQCAQQTKHTVNAAGLHKQPRISDALMLSIPHSDCTHYSSEYLSNVKRHHLNRIRTVMDRNG